MRTKEEKDLEDIYGECILEEGKISDAGHIILDLAGLGFDFAGGQGAWFDAINALWYAAEKNYLYAGLSLISAIPFIGDVVGKGGKYLVASSKIGAKGTKVGSHAIKAGGAMASPKTVKMLKQVKGFLKLPKVQKQMGDIFNKASENEKLAPHVAEMEKALKEFAEQDVMENPEDVRGLS